jgi:hypothetical protein
MERRPPISERDKLKRRVLELHLTTVRNTELRFRVQQLVAKFNSYVSYWDRVSRQMEEGTYHRDVFKARLRSKPAQKPKAQEEIKQPLPLQPLAAGLNKRSIHTIYSAYVNAKKRCRENIGGLTPDKLAISLSKQIPAIKKRYNCKAVEFKVVIKGGKAILKAVPKF